MPTIFFAARSMFQKATWFRAISQNPTPRAVSQNMERSFTGSIPPQRIVPANVSKG